MLDGAKAVVFLIRHKAFARKAQKRFAQGCRGAAELGFQMLRFQALARFPADAENHPFEPGAYDVVQANFGVMFFADSTAAFANLRRAVRPGGRFAATVWGGPADNPWFSLPRRIVDETVSDVPRPDPSGPGPMRFAEVAELERLLTATGWAPSVQTRDLALTPPGPPSQVARLLMTVNVGMMLKGIEATTPQLEAIETALTEALAAFEQTDQIAIPARIHVVTAQAI